MELEGQDGVGMWVVVECAWTMEGMRFTLTYTKCYIQCTQLHISHTADDMHINITETT